MANKPGHHSIENTRKMFQLTTKAKGMVKNTEMTLKYGNRPPMKIVLK
jgi:hypothetical protein